MWDENGEVKPEFVADDENSEDEPPKAEEAEVNEEQQLLFRLSLRRLRVAEKPLTLCSTTVNTYSEKIDKRQVYLPLPEHEIHNFSSPANESSKVNLSGV
ncbi:MAG: hypothetical protein GY861_18350, partial [bacterium]|nr:hypothetical protein [bacterium]